MDSEFVPDLSERLTKARAIAEVIGKIPVFFSIPIRALLADNKNGMSPGTHFLITRLLKSPSLKAAFYYAALTFRGDSLTNTPYLSSEDLIKLFSPAESAAIIALYFIQQRLTHAGDFAKDRDWLDTLCNAQVLSEIGGHLGTAIPRFGMDRAMFVGGLPLLVEGFFYLQDINALKNYKEDLLATGERFDLEREKHYWGCTRFDIAANILQLMGFGIQLSHSFLTTFNKDFSPNVIKNSDEEELLLIDEWIQCLYQTGAEPKHDHKGCYYPMERDAHKLMYEVSTIRQNGSKYCWMLRTQKDIDPETTPQLFQEVMQSIKEKNEQISGSITEELLQTLSQEELDALHELAKETEEN